MILSRDTPTFIRLWILVHGCIFHGGVLLNAAGLRRCAGSKRYEDESVPCDCIDWILDARHPANATIGNTSNILIEPNLHPTAALKHRRAGLNRMINDEHNYRADCSYHDTRQVHAGNSDETKFGENRVPDDCPQDAQEMSRTSPSPLRFTILLPMKPAMSPTITHDRIPMTTPPLEVLSTFCASYNLSSFEHSRPPRPI